MPTIVSTPAAPAALPPAPGDGRAVPGQGTPTFSDTLQAALASGTSAPVPASDRGAAPNPGPDNRGKARAGAQDSPGRALGHDGAKREPVPGSLASVLSGLTPALTPPSPGASPAAASLPPGTAAAGVPAPQGGAIQGLAAPAVSGLAGPTVTGAPAPVPAPTSAGPAAPAGGAATPTGAPVQAAQATLVSSTNPGPIAGPIAGSIAGPATGPRPATGPHRPQATPATGSASPQAAPAAGPATARLAASTPTAAVPGTQPADPPPGNARAQVVPGGRMQARGVDQTSPGQQATPATQAGVTPVRAGQAAARPQAVFRNDGTPVPAGQAGTPGTAAGAAGTPGDAGALTSNLSPAARKVIEAINQARDATPPNSVVVELPGMDGARLRVSVEGTTVHLALLGESPESALNGLIRDVATGLGSSGLQLGQDGTGQRGDPGNPSGARQQDPAPRLTVPSPASRIRTAGNGLRI